MNALRIVPFEARRAGTGQLLAAISTAAGAEAPRAGWNFADLASSFKLAGSYGDGRHRATLCENAGYAGACSSYLADDPWLGDDASGNDRTSSAKIEVNTNCTGDGVYLYEDRDYWGRCWKWTADDPLFDEENFHDVASSLRFMGSYGDGRYTATLYQDLNYGGASTAFGADDPWLGDDAIGSDQADAIRIRTVPACTGDGVYLYEGANYTGRCRNFTASEPYLDNVAFADIASSVRLAGSYAGGDTKVMLCENARYGGACTTFAGNNANLGDDGVGDDRASSLLIEPLCSAVTEIPPVECRALVALYNSTDGPHWTNRNGWLVTNTPCTTPWVGVQCVGGRVSKLNLVWNGLSGAIPAQLGNLTSLKELYLSTNELSGAIPPQLGNLTSLEDLYLVSNQLSGAIPPQLGNLTSLKVLRLTGNQLSGAIPPQLSDLTNLTYLALDNNQLSGAIPPQLGDLTSLSYLDLRDNQLSGVIPPQLGDLTSLQALDLERNQLTGVIPPQLGNLTSLWQLTLQNNRLSGVIPPQLGDLTKLVHLFLDHSLLSGALPATLTRLTLTGFGFNDTQLCEPPDPAFQAWLAGIQYLGRTGIKCPASTSTPTPTATGTRSPTSTPTGGVTPSPTPTPTATRAPLPCSNLLRNSDFEAGVLAPWATDQQAGLGSGRGAGHGGWLGGAVNSDAELFQEVTIPAPANLGKLVFWWQADAASAQPGDRLAVLIQYGAQADPIWSQAADGAPGEWRRQELDLSAYRGMRVFVTFHAHNDANVATTLRVDNVDLPVCEYGLYLPLVLRDHPASAANRFLIRTQM